MPDALTPALSHREREKTDAPRPHVGPVSVAPPGFFTSGQRLSNLLVQIARQIFQPFQLLKRGAHFRLTLRIVTFQADQRLNQTRRHLRVTAVSSVSISTMN